MDICLYLNRVRPPKMCSADVNVVKKVLFNHTRFHPKNLMLMNPHISRLLGK